MRLDLNDQLQKGQEMVNDDGKKKKRLVLGLAITFGVSLILLIIFSAAFFVKTMDRFLDPNTPRTSYTETSSSYSSGDDDLNAIAWGTRNTTSSGYDLTGSNSATSNFVYGTVSGTSYSSTFSGVRFTAPSGWSLNGHTEGGYSNLLQPTDLKASSADMSTSVTIMYKSQTLDMYSSAATVVSSYKSQVAEGSNLTMINESISASYGGNSFSGIIYKKTMDTTYSYYIEVLEAEVNGYVLEIYVEANSADQLSTAMSYFS